MATIKVKHKAKNYSIISNHAIQDKRLSWKARGLLLYLLSMPENWEVRIRHLKEQAPDGRASIDSAIKELKSLGYFVAEQLRDESGRMAGVCYNVYEDPQHSPDCDFRDTDNQDAENPNTGNQHLININNTNNKDNKKLTAAKDENIAAASFSDCSQNNQQAKPVLTANDALIGQRLTDNQQEFLQHALQGIVLPAGYTQQQLISEVTFMLLSQDHYKGTKQDFQYKLNVLLGVIKRGEWVTPSAMHLQATQKTQSQNQALKLQQSALIAEIKQLKDFQANAKAQGNDALSERLLEDYHIKIDALRELQDELRTMDATRGAAQHSEKTYQTEQQTVLGQYSLQPQGNNQQQEGVI